MMYSIPVAPGWFDTIGRGDGARLARVARNG